MNAFMPRLQIDLEIYFSVFTIATMTILQGASFTHKDTACTNVKFSLAPRQMTLQGQCSISSVILSKHSKSDFFCLFSAIILKSFYPL